MNLSTNEAPPRHVVILAAGQAVRTRPLTDVRPKPLIPLANKPLIMHLLDACIDPVERATIVVGYRADDIRAALGDTYRGIAITYAPQREVNGTGSALAAAAPYVDEPFLMLYGDNLVSREDVLAVAARRPSLAGMPVDNPAAYGILQIEHGSVIGLREKPTDAPPGSLINVGIFHFGPEVFPILQEIPRSPRGEYELTDAIHPLSRQRSIAYHVCTGAWISITTPWNALATSVWMLQRGVTPAIGERIRMGSNCTFLGDVLIGSDVTIEDDCVLDNVVIADGARIGRGSYLNASVIGRHAQIGKACRIGYSWIDDHAQLGPRVTMAVDAGKLTTGYDPDVFQRNGAIVAAETFVAARTVLEAGSIISAAVQA